MISWATKAIGTSSNQPILPHAIIVINASEHDNHPHFWDSKLNTADILESMSKVLDTNKKFSSCADSWRDRGKTINTLQDLVLCYYSLLRYGEVPQLELIHYHGRETN